MRATVRNGRLVMDEPTVLPEGIAALLVVDDAGDDLDKAERGLRDDHIERAWASAQSGQGRDAQAMIAGLRAR